MDVSTVESAQLWIYRESGKFHTLSLSFELITIAYAYQHQSLELKLNSVVSIGTIILSVMEYPSRYNHVLFN